MSFPWDRRIDTMIHALVILAADLWWVCYRGTDRQTPDHCFTLTAMDVASLTDTVFNNHT